MAIPLEQLPAAQESESRFDFNEISVRCAADKRLAEAVTRNSLNQHVGRQAQMAALPDAEGLRELAGRIKQHAIENLDYYLEQLRQAVTRSGGQVHLVSTAEQARELITAIADRAGCKRVVKSKSMVSEEIALGHHLENHGLEVVETDLGEFIVQISHDKPSHLVLPIIHKTRASVGKLFAEYFHTPYTDDPATLSGQARLHLRNKFRRADFGMTGGNFLVAETGHVCVVENEGNARQSLTTPRVLVSLVGIEKIVPRLSDLAVMLKLLARSATGQPMTVYTNIFGGPRQPGEKDGPEEFHLVLIDNGRTEILADEQYRETLRCIRCGACLNACPVYRKIGGHSYGSVYPGPIGALITPLFEGLKKYQDLPQASSLCGACYEACPVKIDIPKHLLQMRRDIVSRHIKSAPERLVYQAWAWVLRSPRLYAIVNQLQKWHLRRSAKGTGWVSKLPPVASGWTKIRDMPAPAAKTFHQLWKGRK